MFQTRFSKIALALLGPVALMLSVGLADARPKPPSKPPPATVIREAILRHNGAVGDMYVFATQANGNYNDCVQVENSDPPQDWSQVEFEGSSMQKVAAGDLRPYNKNLPKWIDALQSLKVDADARKNKAKAIELLTQAHDGHAMEFFNFDGEGNKLLLHQCGDAQNAMNAAAKAGDPAWTQERQGLVLARALLHLKGNGTKLSPTVAPWGDAGVQP